MDVFRLSAAGGALALHGLVLAGVLMLAAAPPATREIEPMQVALIAPPEPLPMARAPASPPPAAPQAVERPPPVEAKPPPKPAAPQARPPRPAPPPPKTAAPEPAPRPPPAPTESTAAITPPPAPAAPPGEPAPVREPAPTRATEPAREPVAAPGPSAVSPPASASARSGAGTPSAAPLRSAPRVDATWSGNSPPPYPGLARRMGHQGEVRLDVRVGTDGKVTEVQLRQSSGSDLLDRTAIDTVRKWRFKPATVDGQPVAEWYHDWRWVFRLEG